MKKILVLDNYDSFTYNLVQYVRELAGFEIEVHRNDKIELDAVAVYKKILLSPGPGIPEEAGIMPALVRQYASRKSILGVCLGHQCIGEVFGAALINMIEPVHGKASRTSVLSKENVLFQGLPNDFMTGRYHSWLVSKENFPGCLKITAEDEQGRIMALSHAEFDVHGVQFHPESVLTEHGKEILKNWLDAA